MTKPTTIDAYLAAQPEETRRVLDQVRATLQKAMPRRKSRMRFPPTRCTARTCSSSPAAEALAKYAISKGTIRFLLDEPPPLRLIARIAKFRAKEADASAKEKKATKKSGRH